MQVILWMLGFVALIVLLVLLKSKMHLSFSIRVLVALLLGAAFGLALFFYAEKTINQEVRRWVSLVGFGYVDLLRMLIIPLVPTSIIAGLIKLSNTSELKQMGVRTIGIFLFTATVAGIIGLLVGNIFSVGTGMAIGDLAAREASTVTNLFSQFRNFIPSNFVKSAAETNMIPLVVFSIFIGVSAIMVKTKKPEAVKPFQDILESFLQIVMQLTKIVLKLTPYGVLGLTTYWLSSTGMSALLSLGIFVVAMVVACLVQLVVVYGGLLTSVAKVNPIRFYRAASPALLLAFSSRSSLGSLTMTISTMTDRLKVNSRVANFVGPLGAVMNMDACGGIFPAMVAVFAANAFGIDLSVSQYVLIVIVSVLASLGSAAVPMGATAFTVITLTTVGLPVEAVGLVAGVDFIVDMFRTMTNVAGDMTTSVLVANSLDEFDREAFNTQDFKAIV
ncbi:MAG: dicarboxylate/amino acid:cation symporter [Spirochaetae bacterium HGW-Spirochaetae-4]|nr:MAG: sodium:dicarboxylate symporter [Spirochaetes bacterium GWC2_52_13]PKL20053.1 MAG: dicarboxylate/amino acid:cation symporter [Spirochaetae bacterium HGW-Spirochaetae-4]HCS37425.1 dicarboxylate/amino acid:cation symporter [Sphaerochaeta sp.]